MFPWTKLPVELRHEVVKRMDFVSRFCFRGVSKADEQLVDSVPLYIPRVVFNSQHANKAHLTFYLDIGKRIDVFFDKEKDGKFKVTRSRDLLPEGNPRYVELSGRHLHFCETALVYAIIVFRNVAMNPKTILDGFEFVPKMFDSKNTAAMLYFFGKLHTLPNRFVRAKTLMLENGSYTTIITCCSIPDLLELQILFDSPSQPPLVSYTKRQRYRIYNKKELKSFEKEGTGLKLDNQYIVTEIEDVTQLGKRPGDWERFVAEWKAVEVAPNRYVTHEANGRNNHRQSHSSSCGFLIQKSTHKAEKEDPTACDLRWACAKHADPFEHWYYTRKFPHLITWQPSDALLNFDDKPSYYEHVFPVINGKSIVLNGYIKMARDSLAEGKIATIILPGTRVRRGMHGNDPTADRVYKQSKGEQRSWKRSQASKIMGKPVSTASEREMAKGEVQKAPVEQPLAAAGGAEKGSEMKSKPENGSEALKSLEKPVSAALEKEIAEVQKAPDEQPLDAADGAEERSEVTLDDSEADEDLCHPSNTDELKSEFSESGLELDKLWAFLITFAVLTVGSSFFLTFWLSEE